MMLTDNVVGCWNPYMRGGGYLLPDLTSGNNHGTLLNMDAGTDWVSAAVRWQAAKVLDFDGVNDYVTISNGPTLNITNFILTLSCWANIRSITGFPYLIFKGSGGSVQYAIGLNNTQQRFFVGGSAVSVSFVPTAGEWNYYTGVCDGVNVMLYRNGIQVGTGTRSGTTTVANPVELGRINGINNYVDGQIGETAIFSRPVSAAEVMELYRRGNGAIGRMLTGQSRRRTYGFVAGGFRPYWARQRAGIIGGGVR